MFTSHLTEGDQSFASPKYVFCDIDFGYQETKDPERTF